MALRSYKDLGVWKKALKLVAATYKLSAGLPSDERFGITSQIRRAAVSVVANVAEGNGRIHRAEYVHHLSIARGSLLEVEALVYTSIYLGLSTPEQSKVCLGLVDETGRMLTTLIRALLANKQPVRH